MSTYNMYCPMCGHELIEVVPPEKDSGCTDIVDNDTSEKFICNNCKCFGPGYELILHHPLGGMKTGPGDSWSLTWLK